MIEDDIAVHLSEGQLRLVIQTLGALLSEAGKPNPKYLCPVTEGGDIEEIYMLSTAFGALLATLE
ncbi:hypothetical protein [Rhizobium sp. YK2]|uniref:hypothetical protein n=1 Tax=Rhizobium sp. YK2 TaxID=1860096 RepID=UPI0008693F4C|nr:hypothetical protein [Rhizobium sp. YK2]OEC93619.1 hypothetical protein A9Z06_09355 [Rhizobium sp. YK2]